MKKWLGFIVPLLLAALLVAAGGNMAMGQMSALVGTDYAQVLDVAWEGEASYVEIGGQRHYFDGTVVQNAIYQIKSTIQSAAEGVKYGLDRR